VNQIKYQKGFKYRLHETYGCHVDIYPKEEIDCKFGSLDEKGNLEIFAGFMWDGCSGPTIDSKKNMRAGLVHDFLCYLMRQGHLDRSWHPNADKAFLKILEEDKFYASHPYYWAVSSFGGFASDPKNKRKVLTAP